MNFPFKTKTARRFRLVALLGLVAIAALAAVSAFATGRPSKPSVKGPHNPTGRTTAVFRFRSHGRVRYVCGLDGSALKRCSSSKKYSGLKPGSHTFRVRALDGHGKSSRTATYRWLVDTTHPAVSEIRRAQPSPTNAGTLTWSVRFTKQVSGVTAGNFRLATAHLGGSAPSIQSVRRQGGSPRSQNWAVAVSTAGTSGADDGSIELDLADGTSVRDAAGNSVSGSFAGEAYLFDTSAPGAPVNLNGPADPSPAGPSSKSNFTWQSGAGDTAGFRCRLDGAALNSCSSPTTYSGLGEGSHTFKAIAVDAAGNQSAPATFTWNILKAPKNWTITGNVPSGLFPGAGGSPINLSFTNQNPYSLTVQSLSVSVQSVTKAAGAPAGTCSAGDFATTNLTGGTFTLPTGSSSLSSLGIATSRWPTLRMVETGLNQDACKGASVKLSYQGVAVK